MERRWRFACSSLCRGSPVLRSGRSLAARGGAVRLGGGRERPVFGRGRLGWRRWCPALWNVCGGSVSAHALPGAAGMSVTFRPLSDHKVTLIPAGPSNCGETLVPVYEPCKTGTAETATAPAPSPADRRHGAAPPTPRTERARTKASRARPPKQTAADHPAWHGSAMADGHLVLVAGALLTAGLAASLLAGRLRLPSLVLFLGVGMAVGTDGLGWVDFSNYRLARDVGIVALALILFEGGLNAGFAEIRPVLKPVISLAFLGTLITAAICGLAATWLFDFTLLEGLLLGAIVSSTDGVAIFAMLRGSSLKRKLARTLEGEAG